MSKTRKNKQALKGRRMNKDKTGKVLPEAVKEVTSLKSGESHLTVNYHALTSILIEAIKELTAEIEELKEGL